MENKTKKIEDIKIDSKLSSPIASDISESNSVNNTLTNKFKNLFKSKKKANSNISIEEANYKISDSLPKSKLKSFWKFIRLPLVSICCLGAICGIAYPLVITAIGQSVFWYQANGSQINVKGSDGEWITYGSDKIGQDFYTNNDGKYFFGRADFVKVDDNKTVEETIKNKLTTLIKDNNLTNEYQDANGKINIPDDLITISGSGVDPSISIEAAEWQIPLILAVRNKENPSNKLTKNDLEEYIKEYSSQKFVGIYGNTTTNIVLLNLRLDGKISK